MRTTVTAILVAQTGDRLDETLEALAAQTRQPDRLIGVVNGSNEALAAQLAEAGADQVIVTGKRLSYGAAIAAADRAIAADGEQEWLWLLAEDTAPEPKALRSILRTVQKAPSVAVAGPKLLDWDHPERIIELGQSLTRYGNRWKLRRQELDQQQYDHIQDTLGVGPAGMLVRRQVWQELGGFDPGLPVFDDGLDFSLRARLAGYRVVVAPKSRVRYALSGVAGPRIDRSRKVLRQAHHQARLSHLHRRLTYAPAPLAFLMWILLPALAIFRVFWLLLREQPGNIPGELAATLRVFFTPVRVIRARSRLRLNNKAGWGAIRPLRTDPKTVRTALAIDREAILAAQGRQRQELHFISTGGLGLLVVSVAVSVALTWWLFGQQTLGGGIIPLSDLGELWRNTHLSEGIPADPFTWILALLGSLTPFNPSLSLVLLLAAAIPLASLGGWLWGAQFTSSAAGRVLAGVAWAFSPVLLGSLDHGRLPTIVLAVVLPWLLIAATRAHESWAWAGTASLLALIGLAAAPVLIPAALLFWIVGIITHPRGIVRYAAIAIAPAALFLPLVIHAVLHGDLLSVLRDPGITSSYTPSTLPHLLLGFPEFGLEGWGDITANLGIDIAPTTLLVGLLLLPLILLVLLGAYTGKANVTVFASLLGGLGLITAVASAHLALTTQGAEVINLWTGSGLSLYWIAIVTLAANGSAVLGRGAKPLVAIALLLNLVVVLPLLADLVIGRAEVRNAAQQMPSLVQAAGRENPQLRTLVLEANSDNSVTARIVTGPGLRFDEIRTAAYRSQPNSSDEQLATLVGALASNGATNLAEQLSGNRIDFVLLEADGDPAKRAELQATIEEHGALAGAGDTATGHLWRVSAVSDPGAETAAEPVDENPVIKIAKLRFTATSVWIVQALLLVGMLLLALPTGEVVARPEKRPRVKKRQPREPRQVAVPAGQVAAAKAADPAEAAEVAAAEPADADAEAAPATAEAPADTVEPAPVEEPTAGSDGDQNDPLGEDSKHD